MRNIAVHRLLALSALTLAIGAAQATTLPYKGFDRLVAEADGIVVGTVHDVRSRMDSRRDIHTDVTFDNLQVLGGKTAGKTLTLRLKGGVVEHEMLRVEGVPNFRSGERVLMFVQGNGRDLAPFVGWSQGLFRLVTDAATGAQTVADADGRAVIGFDGNRILVDGNGAANDVHLAGEPQADRVRHEAGIAQASAGRTDDGSVSQLVGVRKADARPMSAEAFIEQVRQRSAAHGAWTTTLGSVSGDSAVAADERDAASRNARANAVVRSVVDTGKPVAPQRLERAAAPDLQ